MVKITEMFAFVMTDSNGDEGIIGEQMGGQWFPFIGVDTNNMERMIKRADFISLSIGKPYKILKFKLQETIDGTATNMGPGGVGTC